MRVYNIASLALACANLADGAGLYTRQPTLNDRNAGAAFAPIERPAALFPLLTRLRDGAVEFFFGRHPSAAADEARLQPDKRVQHVNEVVLRFNVTTHEEETALADAALRLFLDVWAFTQNFVDIRLHADGVAPLLKLLPQSLQSAHSILISDLAQAVSQSRTKASTRPDATFNSDSWSIPPGVRFEENLFFQDYQPLPVINRWLGLLEAMFPAHVETIKIGSSFEGRDISAVRVGTSRLANPSGEPRKTLVVTGGAHAREWISTSTVNYLAWVFITSYGQDNIITKLLDEYDIVFIPVLNPDGVQYTWDVDRLWRKSRQDTDFRLCPGYDLDHSFGFQWDDSSIRSDPCSESYGGAEPFQAIEALHLADWATNETLHGVKFLGLLDLHSYSQQILFPFSYSCAVDPPNLENLEELGAGLAKAIRLSNGESYSLASACEGSLAAGRFDDRRERDRIRPRIESGGGSIIDWFYHEMGAHFSYQVKLRDTGSYGFLLPKEYIIPTGEEMLNALKYFGDFLLGNNGIEKQFDAEEDSANGGDCTASNAFHCGQDEHDDSARSMELKKRQMLTPGDAT